MNIEQIIEKAGGVERVVSLTGVSTEAIRKWRQTRSIPSKHWATLLNYADIKLDDLNPNPKLKMTIETCPPRSNGCARFGGW